MTIKSLWDMQAGDAGIVIDHIGASRHGDRLAELGLATGEHVQVLQHGAAMRIQVGNATLCVRPDPNATISIACGL